jgi:putative membrane protein
MPEISHAVVLGSEFVQRASSVFSESDRRRLNALVRQAEMGTSAEIVPVVATASGRYDRAEDLMGLWLGVGLMIVVSVWWPSPAASIDAGSWGTDPAVMQIIKLTITMVVGFLLGAILGARVSWLRRLFTPARQTTDEVKRAAQAVFFDQRIHHTQSGGGLLIYLSLFEHTAVILADRKVLAALGQPVLDELCGALVQQVRTGNLTEALCQTIQAAGNKLMTVMPAQQDDVNELSDALVTID